MKNKTAKWLLVAAVAAVIAAVTTVAIIALRARAKKKAWYEEEADFDYDLEDEFVFEDAADADVEAVEE